MPVAGNNGNNGGTLLCVVYFLHSLFLSKAWGIQWIQVKVEKILNSSTGQLTVHRRLRNSGNSRFDEELFPT